MGKLMPLEGNNAVAEAMRQIDPDVVAAYPITPSTEIVQTFAKFVADGLVHTNFVAVESEHSAMTACTAAAAAGGRVMNATSANGMALMWEILYITSPPNPIFCAGVSTCRPIGFRRNLRAAVTPFGPLQPASPVYHASATLFSRASP